MSALLLIANVLNVHVLFLSFNVITVGSSAFKKPILHLSNSLHLQSKYSCMSACSFLLMWSSVRFVNRPMSKSQPVTLSNFNACEETSIMTTSTFSSAICAKCFCISTLSGVVLSVSSIFLLPMYTAMLPISPTFSPCASSNDFIIKVVVVFPFVPVTPISLNFLDGLSYRLQLDIAKAFLVLSTFM